MMRKLLLDVVERAGWTAAQAFLAVWVVGDLNTLRSAGVAAAAAAVSVVKGFVASRVGDDHSAATLPGPKD